MVKFGKMCPGELYFKQLITNLSVKQRYKQNLFTTKEAWYGRKEYVLKEDLLKLTKRHSYYTNSNLVTRYLIVVERELCKKNEQKDNTVFLIFCP